MKIASIIIHLREGDPIKFEDEEGCISKVANGCFYTLRQDNLPWEIIPLTSINYIEYDYI